MKTTLLKKIIIVTLLTIIPKYVIATPVDSTKAKEIAEHFFKSNCDNARVYGNKNNIGSSLDLQLVFHPVRTMEEKNASPEYFVFAPTDSIGFVIVSGEENLNPIIGYSFENKFSKQPMPPALNNFLNTYQNYVRDIRDNKIEAKRQTKAKVTPIEPFIRTTWAQRYPYNALCPRINNRNTLTGCGATALAQIMKYYEWPQRGHGTCEASIDDGYGNITPLSLQLGEEYDWSNMLNDYSNTSYTEENFSAISTLMRDVGYACKTTFGINASSSYPTSALIALLHNFDYSPDIKLVNMDYYSYDNWEKLIYEELTNKRPVWYIGQDINEGHIYICCGINSYGMYYINWGWAGDYDGYYDMDYLSPGRYNYSSEQQAIINIKPIAGDESVTDYQPIPNVGRLEITDQDNSFSNPSVTYTIYLSNTTDRTIYGKLGYGIYKNDKMITPRIYDLISYKNVLPDWYYWNEGVNLFIENEYLTPGVKEIRFLWRHGDGTEYVEPLGEHTIYMYTAEEGNFFSTNKDDFPSTSNIDNISPDDLKISNIDGGILLLSTKSTQIKIVGLHGMTVDELTLRPNIPQTCILPQGVYIIDGTKVIVK